MTYGRELLLENVREKIENAIKASAPAWKKFVNKNRSPASLDPDRRPLAMKYVQSKWAKDYVRKPNNNGFYIGNKDFTWGKAVYVTGVKQPLSTAPYGRVGLVSYFEPDGPDGPWRVFDARDKANADLYLEWLRLQLVYDDAILTVHTNHWLHGLRNYFREEFSIDVVLCEPDEHDEGWKYTHPKDIWLCVSDFGFGPSLPPINPKLPPNHRWLASNYSARFPDVRLTIVPEEEFVGPEDPTSIRPPHDPLPRVAQLAVSGKAPVAPNVVRAYWQNKVVTVPS